MRRIVLLPGMDGTGRLFTPFVAAAPAHMRCEVVSLPQEPLDYADLAARLGGSLHLTPDTILLAESFSGPLAVMLAARTRVAAVVLCNTFVRPSIPAALRFLAPILPFRLPLPDAVLRRWLLGPDASDGLLADLRAALSTVPSAVLAARVIAMTRVNVVHEIAGIKDPLLYVRSLHDRLVPDASVDAASQAAPDMLVHRLAGPHLLLQAMPVAAWMPIRDFVDRLPERHMA